MMWFQALTLPLRSILGAATQTRYKHILPRWWIQKGIGHIGIMSYYKVFMPFKAKRFLYRKDGQEVIFDPVFPPVLPGDYLACQSVQVD